MEKIGKKKKRKHWKKNGKKVEMLRLLLHGLMKNKAWLLLSGCNCSVPRTFSYLCERGLCQKGSGLR